METRALTCLCDCLSMPVLFNLVDVSSLVLRIQIIFILLGVAGLTEELRQANKGHLYSKERPCCLYLDQDQMQ